MKQKYIENCNHKKMLRFLQYLRHLGRIILKVRFFFTLGTLLGMMHSTSVTNILLKIDLLCSIVCIFEINPQIRSVFQEVGGFVYVASVLVGLEGSLASPVSSFWEKGLCILF